MAPAASSPRMWPQSTRGTRAWGVSRTLKEVEVMSVLVSRVVGCGLNITGRAGERAPGCKGYLDVEDVEAFIFDLGRSINAGLGRDEAKSQNKQ